MIQEKDIVMIYFQARPCRMSLLIHKKVWTPPPPHGIYIRWQLRNRSACKEPSLLLDLFRAFEEVFYIFMVEVYPRIRTIPVFARTNCPLNQGVSMTFTLWPGTFVGPSKKHFDTMVFLAYFRKWEAYKLVNSENSWESK